MSSEKIKVDLNLSNDLIPLIEDLGLPKSLNDNITICIAIALFTSKSVSLARSAEIAEMHLADFMVLLKNKNIAWNEYTEEEFCMDEIAVKEFKELEKNKAREKSLHERANMINSAKDEGKIEVVKNALREGLNTEMISKITGKTFEEIGKIKKMIN